MLSIRKNQMTIAQYDKICLVTNTMVGLEVHGKTVKIQGEDLQVSALEKEEVALKGLFQSITFHE